MLNDTILRNIKAKDKPYKKTDSSDLYIYVTSKGKKVFRIDFTFEKKRKTYTIGEYPIISLVEARQILYEVKIKLKEGIDPTIEKQSKKQILQEEEENIFENIASEWIETKQSDKSPKHRKDVLSKLERFIYPTLKERGIHSITSREMLEVIRKIEAKGLYETAKKVLGICNQIYTFAIGEGKAELNICAGLSRQLKSVKVKHHAFITDKKILGALLRDIDNYPHNILIKTALQVAPLVFLRPSELINARWTEIDFENKLWTIPPERMKLRRTHLVPFSEQVYSLLKSLYEITGDTEYSTKTLNNISNYLKEGKEIAEDLDLPDIKQYRKK